MAVAATVKKLQLIFYVIANDDGRLLRGKEEEEAHVVSQECRGGRWVVGVVLQKVVAFF